MTRLMFVYTPEAKNRLARRLVKLAIPEINLHTRIVEIPPVPMWRTAKLLDLDFQYPRNDTAEIEYIDLPLNVWRGIAKHTRSLFAIACAYDVVTNLCVWHSVKYVPGWIR